MIFRQRIPARMPMLGCPGRQRAAGQLLDMLRRFRRENMFTQRQTMRQVIFWMKYDQKLPVGRQQRIGFEYGPHGVWLPDSCVVATRTYRSHRKLRHSRGLILLFTADFEVLLIGRRIGMVVITRGP